MAFFLSIEFQQSGYFVERLYEACLNKRPSYREFMRDLQRIGVGVVVGAPGWEVLLEKNTRDLPNSLSNVQILSCDIRIVWAP